MTESCVDCRWQRWKQVLNETHSCCSHPGKQENDPIYGRSRVRLCVLVNSKGECTSFEEKIPLLKRLWKRLTG